tara:strand:- start:5379 stop:5675 length:297 start_codon:yes stop_codon:yes gene_type:complete
MIKLTEVRQSAGSYDSEKRTVISSHSLQSIYLNEEYIFLMRENKMLKKKVLNDPALSGLSRDIAITQLSLASPGTAPLLINVVGSVEQVLEAINKAKN